MTEHNSSDATRRIHKKADGYLLIERNGRCRFLTFTEYLLWRFAGIMPKEPNP